MLALLRNTETVQEFAWRIIKSIPQQYNTFFFVCDLYKKRSIKNVERIGLGPGMKHIYQKRRKKPRTFGFDKESIYII